MDRERNDIDKDKPHLLRMLDPKLNGEFELFRRKRHAPFLSLGFGGFCPIDILLEKTCEPVLLPAWTRRDDLLLCYEGQRMARRDNRNRSAC